MNYNSIEALEIELNTYVFNNALKTLTNLTIIKCNPNILNLLPLNNYHENNITTLIIQNGTKKLEKNMFKFCKNLEFISIPLLVEIIEEDSFSKCSCLRVVECAPHFLDYFNNNYITTFIIQEGIKTIYKRDFLKVKYLQNLIIPKSVNYIEEGAFYLLKKLIVLKCEEKWNNDKYFPFTYIIEEGTKIIDINIFRGWYNLKSLSILNSVNTIFPFTFSDCRDIENLECSPNYFKFLNVKKVKVLILPEGVKVLKNGVLKGFVNLIYLKLPNSIRDIDEDVFKDTPCLNFDNISDHPIIRRIKKKKFEEYNDIKNKKYNKLNSFNFPLFDIPNYNFENENKKNNENDEEKEEENEDDYNDENEEEENNEEKNFNYLLNSKSKKNIENKYNDDKNMYYNHSYLNLNDKNNNYNNEKLINNFLNNKKNNKKIERTVEDIIKYDETNRKYALFITKILNSINKGTIINFKNNKNGYELENLSYKLDLICIKIKKANNFTQRPVQI